MDTNISSESLVLLAIIQYVGKSTPEQVENKAKKLAELEDNIKYSGPKPDFTKDNVFNSAWNELVDSDYITQHGSNGSVPIFRSNTDRNVVSEICKSDSISEQQSFEMNIINF